MRLNYFTKMFFFRVGPEYIGVGEGRRKHFPLKPQSHRQDRNQTDKTFNENDTLRLWPRIDRFGVGQKSVWRCD